MNNLELEFKKPGEEGIKYNSVLKLEIKFGVGLKVLPTKGNLVYEYNPLRNYRLTKTGYLYKNRLYSPKELLIELKAGYTVTIDSETNKATYSFCLKGSSTNCNIVDETLSEEACLQILESAGKTWPEGLIPDSETNPVLVEPGELTDFETNELKFDINHPVDILPQYSYDNSVNLVINDGKNVPRMINTRFSATERNHYLIVDRKGNNDTNIYDLGSQFDIDTSLYKRVVEIPRLRFTGITGGGRLPVGNYHFYFRYADADGNETDFVAESGLVSIFIGMSTPASIRAGFRDEDSHKAVQFTLSNVDSAYLYVNVYYTRSTADIYENAVVKAVKIELKFLVNNALKCNIVITGYEDTTEIPLTDINPMYLIASSVETQASCQNMLFIGNIHKPEIPYRELEDLSLRFLPYINNSEEYPVDIDADYNISSTSRGYYDPKFIYNKVGYWNHELYRLGIVYILSDNLLSPVFNIRGIENLSNTTSIYSKIPMWTDEDKKTNRNYIVVEEDTYKIVTDPASYFSTNPEFTTSTDHNLENAKGVISIEAEVEEDKLIIYSIGIKTNEEVISYLKEELGIKGFFFVRLRRIPTILCQAYTIGIDKESRTPILPLMKGPEKSYVAERFLDDKLILTHDFENRLYKFRSDSNVRIEGAICPDYDVDYPYYNSIFTGDELSVQEADIQPALDGLIRNNRNFVAEGCRKSNSLNLYRVKILGIEDDMKLAAINNKMFSARAGEAEEAYRYEYLEKENKIEEASNLIRGSFGPYLGITGFPYSGKIINIRVPGYDLITPENLFKIRYNDKSSFYAISERIALKEIDDWFELDLSNPNEQNNVKLSYPLFRGDCYICQFTHRLNRNFQDPSSLINDKIVDSHCWEENYKIEDNVVKLDEFENINLGDVNAVKLGMWVTFTLRSTKNLNIRTLDDSLPDEIALTGHPRGFYPYYPMTAEGAYKIPEALCCNKGFEKSVSERWNFEVPDVPALKNDFTNRIAYSDIHVNDAFKNGFRVFQGSHYRDYPKTYGSITKIIEFDGDLICIFEHGVGVLSVKERVMSGEGTGGLLYINTKNVLPENPLILSDSYGSLWRESIIKTPKAIYGVDTVGKKIWRCNKTTFLIISDFSVLKFLNDNISLSERELLPIIGIRNVKTHYNAYKGDVMFTFYDNLYGFEERVWNLCWNEMLGIWVTFYSWLPSYSENIYNQYFSFDRNTSKWIAKLGVSHLDNLFSDGVVLKNNIIELEDKNWNTTLDLSNRNLPKLKNVITSTEYELVRDNYGNHKLFSIEGNTLTFTGKYKDILAEFYARTLEIIFEGEPKIIDGLYTLNGYNKKTYILFDPKSTRHIAPTTDNPNLEINLPIRYVRYKHYTVKYTWYTYRYFYTDGEVTTYIESDTDPTDIVWTKKVKHVLATNLESRGSHLYTITGVIESGRTYLEKMLNTAENPHLIEDVYTYFNKTREDDFWTVEAALRYWTLNELYITYNDRLEVYKDDNGKRWWLPKDKLINGDKVALLLNIRAHVKLTYEGVETSLGEAFTNSFNNNVEVDAGYYDSVVAVIPKYNIQFLTTDFWKHGRAGIIDIADKIYPTYWYGKLHPFEFEFIVSNDRDCHKIFDNLEIISNKAAPESFHYEIVGDCYEFAKDKKNMYIRQEATKELYQFNGSDILFDHSYKELLSEHRPLFFGDPDPKLFDKSTIFPAYYSRLDTINEIEDYYHLYKDDGTKGNKDFSALAGAELVRYTDLDEYRIWNHAKAVDIKENGLLRGNMYYKEDKWCVQINSINFVLKNEAKEEWRNKYKLSGDDRYNLVPAECNLFPPPAPRYEHNINNPNLATLPNDWERNIVTWKDYQKINKEAKVKDKFIKIRIRYSGKDLAIITAIRTLYSISYA